MNMAGARHFTVLKSVTSSTQELIPLQSGDLLQIEVPYIRSNGQWYYQIWQNSDGNYTEKNLLVDCDHTLNKREKLAEQILRETQQQFLKSVERNDEMKAAEKEVGNKFNFKVDRDRRADIQAVHLFEDGHTLLLEIDSKYGIWDCFAKQLFLIDDLKDGRLQTMPNDQFLFSKIIDETRSHMIHKKKYMVIEFKHTGQGKKQAREILLPELINITGFPPPLASLVIGYSGAIAMYVAPSTCYGAPETPICTTVKEQKEIVEAVEEENEPAGEPDTIAKLSVAIPGDAAQPLLSSAELESVSDRRFEASVSALTTRAARRAQLEIDEARNQHKKSPDISESCCAIL